MTGNAYLSYYQRNKEFVLAKSKEYYKKNRDRLSKQARERYNILPEKEKNKRREFAKNRR